MGPQTWPSSSGGVTCQAHQTWGRPLQAQVERAGARFTPGSQDAASSGRTARIQPADVVLLAEPRPSSQPPDQATLASHLMDGWVFECVLLPSWFQAPERARRSAKQLGSGAGGPGSAVLSMSAHLGELGPLSSISSP